MYVYIYSPDMDIQKYTVTMKIIPIVPILGPLPNISTWYAQYRNTYTPLVDRLARQLGQHEPLTRHTYRTTTCLSTS